MSGPRENQVSTAPKGSEKKLKEGMPDWYSDAMSKDDRAIQNHKWIGYVKDILLKDPANSQALTKGVKLTKDSLEVIAPNPPGTTVSPWVDLINGDVLVVAEQLHKIHGGPVVVHSFGKHDAAGGKFTVGSCAQEESICIRTTLYESLLPMPAAPGQPAPPSLYPLNSNELIYSRDVLVVGLEPLHPRPKEEWFSIDVVTSAAPYRPRGKDAKLYNVVERDYVTHYDYEVMIEQLRLVMRAAVARRARSVVLGAFGCGHFQNPPVRVAEALKSILIDDLDKENWCTAGINQVAIVINDSDTDNIVWPAFAKVFNGSPAARIDNKGKALLKQCFCIDTEP